MNGAVKIIMIEDDEGHVRLIEKNIRRAGVSNEIVHLSDGASALGYFFNVMGKPNAQRSSAVLILLDLNLPDMTGVEILQRLKADDVLKLAPVIVLTTTDDKTEIQRCYDLGCNVYVTKPVDYDNFANAIRQLGLFFSVIQIPDSPL
ncbi:MAG: response regulator [Hyphomicrobiales bacterium]|nr:response regulator [Hyphomicrobiales bacterium]